MRFFLRKIARIVLLFFLIGVPLAIFVPPDRLFLFPSREPLAHAGATRSTIPFRNGELEVWTARSRPHAATDQRADLYVLRFYGNADRADPNVGIEMSEDWSSRDVILWGVNYPGFGGSSGSARLEAIGPAALTAYDEMRRRAGPDRPIIVFGTSIGTTVALHVAAQRPDVAGVILQNPPPLRQMVLRSYGWWNLWLIAGPVAMHIPRALDSVTNARAVHARGVFVLSDKDEVVAPKYHRLVIDAFGGEKQIVPLPGAFHNSPIEGPARVQFKHAVDWLLSKQGAQSSG